MAGSAFAKPNAAVFENQDVLNSQLSRVVITAQALMGLMTAYQEEDITPSLAAKLGL